MKIATWLCRADLKASYVFIKLPIAPKLFVLINFSYIATIATWLTKCTHNYVLINNAICSLYITCYVAIIILSSYYSSYLVVAIACFIDIFIISIKHEIYIYIILR